MNFNVKQPGTPSFSSRVLARIRFRRSKKHVAATMTCRLGKIFLVKCQKQAFSFNKWEAKVYCYAFLHVLKRDTCINHEKTNIGERPYLTTKIITLSEFLNFVHRVSRL
jgi:hypothetical protein